MPYIERKIVSGELVEVSRYWVPRMPGQSSPLRRSGIGQETGESMEQYNERAAWQRLARLIRCNFSGPAGDLVLTLTCRERLPEEDFKRELARYLRRIRAYRRKASLPELRYVCVTECQSGRWHAHLILSAMPVEDALKLWEPMGRAWASHVDDREITGADALAAYLLEQDKPRKGDRQKPGAENAKEPRRKGKRRWSCSQNLVQPTVTIREIKRVGRQPPKPPKDAVLLPGWRIGCDPFGNLFQHYAYILMPRK